MHNKKVITDMIKVFKKRKHSSRMRTIDLPTVPVLAVTTRCQDDWGRGVGIPTPWDTNSPGYLTPGYLPSVRDLGPETLILQKDLGPELPNPLPHPVGRHTPVKTLPPRKFVGER